HEEDGLRDRAQRDDAEEGHTPGLHVIPSEDLGGRNPFARTKPAHAGAPRRGSRSPREAWAALAKRGRPSQSEGVEPVLHLLLLVPIRLPSRLARRGQPVAPLLQGVAIALEVPR